MGGFGGALKQLSIGFVQLKEKHGFIQQEFQLIIEIYFQKRLDRCVSGSKFGVVLLPGGGQEMNRSTFIREMRRQSFDPAVSSVLDDRSLKVLLSKI